MQRLQDKYQALKDALPQFLAIANKYDTKPQVQFFDGIEGLKNLYEDHLTSQEDLLSFLWIAEVNESFKKYLYEDFLPRRVKAKVFAKVIVSSEAANKTYASINKKNMKATLVIPDPLFTLENEIVIYGWSKVSISLFSPDEMSGLIIHSKTLHDTLANLFNLTRKNYTHEKRKK